MSLHVSRDPRPKFTSFGNNCHTPNLPNFAALPREVCEISAAEEMKQSSQKSLKTYQAPMPLVVQNFIALGQTMYEKCVTILHPSVSWRPGGIPVGKCSPNSPKLWGSNRCLIILNKYQDVMTSHSSKQPRRLHTIQ